MHLGLRRLACSVLVVGAWACSDGDSGPGLAAGADGGGASGSASGGTAGGQPWPDGGAVAGQGGAGASPGGTGGAAGSGATAGQGGAAGSTLDGCALASPACPGPPPSSRSAGLVAIDRCAFPLDEGAQASAFAPIVAAMANAMPAVSMAELLADTNRSAVVVGSVPGSPPGLVSAFRWDAAENAKATWVPQGITGSADADVSGLVAGRHVVVVSFYYDDTAAGAGSEKGVRLAFVDVDADPPRYRFALLVEPSGSSSAPDFVPIDIHAGGIAWVGRWLYVADTGRGFRVFDTQTIFRVATDLDQIGCGSGTCRGGLYKYVLPQVGAYRHASACSPRFSFVSVSRQASGPALVSGEYCSGTACSAALAGRLFVWPLDSGGAPAAPRIWPSEAWYAGESHIQGAAASGGSFLLSSSQPAGGAGALYRVGPGGSRSFAWTDSPEDLMIDAAAGEVWSLSEAIDARYVFRARLSAYPAP